METKNKTTLTVVTSIQQPVENVWDLWTQPAHITQWNFASPDWHCPAATNDLHPGGKFAWRMEAKDGSFGFDYSGVYEQVVPLEKITSRLDDGRQVTVLFTAQGPSTTVTEQFEIEDQNTLDLQRTGWQAILNNFKKYAESRTA